MKKYIFGALVAAMFATGCKKESTNPTSTTCKGKIICTNNTTNPYYVKINNVSQGTLNGGSSVTFQNVDKGSYYCEFTQKSGYVFTPTVYATTVNLTCNGNVAVWFP